MLSISWSELFFIITSSVFIFLVVIQANTNGSNGGLTSNGNRANRVSLITKVCAFLALVVFSLSLYMSYDNRNSNAELENISLESIKNG